MQPVRFADFPHRRVELDRRFQAFPHLFQGCAQQAGVADLPVRCLDREIVPWRTNRQLPWESAEDDECREPKRLSKASARPVLRSPHGSRGGIVSYDAA